MSELSSPQDITTATPDQIRKQIHNFSPELIQQLVINLIPEQDDDWAEKLKAVIEGLEDRSQLEQVGKALEPDQFLAIINEHSLINNENHWKLSPLLVGLTPDTFEESLIIADPDQIAFLQHESVTEPIQHHLTLLCHHISETLQEYGDEYENIEKELQFVEANALTQETLQTLCDAFFLVIEHLDQMVIPLISQALSLAWHTNRHDLIDQLSSFKDTAHRMMTVYYGSPASEEELPTGLFARLHDILAAVYGEDSEDPETLHDDEPATEGLSRLGIWYLRDYWKLGLLPELKTPEEVDLDLNTHSEEEREAHREALFTQVRKNLKQRGIETVADLKRNEIFSHEMLVEFLKG